MQLAIETNNLNFDSQTTLASESSILVYITLLLHILSWNGDASPSTAENLNNKGIQNIHSGLF